MRTRREWPRELRGAMLAHRGLHGFGAAENTLEAFEAAADLDLGIELDVRLSRDGVPVVLHDETPERVAGEKRPVSQLTADELSALPLCGGAGRIPTLEKALDAVGGRVPVLIELKHRAGGRALCDAVLRVLEGRRGLYLAESFDPRLLVYLRLRAPRLLRGQLIDAGAPAPLRAAAASPRSPASPQFAAFEECLAAGARTPLPRAVWTVRSPQALEGCLRRGDLPIFEGFLP